VPDVTGADLKKRIVRIMNSPSQNKRGFGRRLLLAYFAAAVTAGLVVCGFVNAPQIRAQSSSTARLAFEVASIRKNKSGDFRSARGPEFLPGGRFVAGMVPIIMIIAFAYDMPYQSSRIIGAPVWVGIDGGERYEIEAKAEEGAVPPGTPVKVRDEKIRSMLQTLLIERFKMASHTETKNMPIYAVVVRKGGARLQKASLDEKACADAPSGFGIAASCHTLAGGRGRGIHGQAVSIADVALFVSNWADRPVVDQTGLDGLFNIQTEGWMQTLTNPDAPTLFEIFDRLGLELKSQKGAVEILVIDHIERPTEN
jgi:uncharacterized protein (TIGR03435 family)